MPVLLIILDNENLNEMKLALSEVHSRNALTIVITDCQNKLVQEEAKIHHLIPVLSIPYI
jgi:glycine cleavage system regulatory protein